MVGSSDGLCKVDGEVGWGERKGKGRRRAGFWLISLLFSRVEWLDRDEEANSFD